ncbi:hypothetical protein PACTADRAFT_48853 [Pachysolen tannophilus NRRL Y-2460]|uniref:Glycosyltransferase family 32 protein n=1 Tax=Pachysolen tannophilus NRRL Y-2460 TaxID=669874 RepID=A0A1E4TZI6_PACTA|nr:hypothetical protein PACTADRAFT_48853 [Pachysolen tannophilus NRRL Y-2460]
MSHFLKPSHDYPYKLNDSSSGIRKILHNKKFKLITFIIAVFYIASSLIAHHRNFSLKELNAKSIKAKTELEKHTNFKKIGSNLIGIHKLPPDTTLREKLTFHFPYEPEKSIPKKIWQTWKVEEDDETFPKNFRAFVNSWKTKNPTFNAMVIPDSACDELIKHLYETVPEVLKAYQLMPKKILKADFFRYLILYARGGTYSDIDTVSLKPVSTWLTFNETIEGVTNNPGLVVGIEADPDRPDWAEWYARRIQFCQWTIQAKAGHPMLRELIAKITEITHSKLERGMLNKIEGKDAGGDIMNWTGPGIFTDTVFEYLNNIYSNGIATVEPQIDWKYFTGMKIPKIVDDVLVFPITCFSPGVGQMGSKSISDELAYVRHMFEGSWKPEDERNIGKKKTKKEKKKN